MKYSSSRKPSKRTWAVAAGAFTFLLIGGGYLYQNNSPANPSSPNDTINLSPPTEQEIKETEEHKKTLPSNSTPTNQNNQESSGVTPVITSADQSTVRAYVSGISEDGGVCTATFTQGASVFSKESSGFRDVNTTICEPIRLERSDFSSSGEWTVVVAYKSSLVEGISREVKINVN